MKDITFFGFGDLLKAVRKQRHLTQQKLATRLGVHRNTIGTWELGDFLPKSKTIVLELARQLKLDQDDTRRLLEASLTALSTYWQVPYQRNPFFTGREDVLQHLHDALTQGRAAVLSQTYVLSGLGGIGKTQIAIEYAYRYSNDYSVILWISAETLESIVSSMIAIATVLNLSEKQPQDQDQVIAAVTRWLNSHSDWLLIFDNVEDQVLVKRFLPHARHSSLLITSRRQSLGLTEQTLVLEQITSEEGIRFLLHRAGLADALTSLDQLSATNVALAREIVSAMDGLPLALDQAGDYIKTIQCCLADYLQLYQKHPIQLLDTRLAVADHSDSVVKTFLISLKNLNHINPAAADILRICSFLSTDAIPEELFTQGAIYLERELSTVAADPYLFNQAIGDILRYSLLKRHAESHTFTLHRLVQVVLQASMEQEIQRYWAEHVVRMLNHIFPQGSVETWTQCQRYLPHAIICAKLIERWHMTFVEAGSLLYGIAHYLHERSHYRQAEPLYRQALYIQQQNKVDLCIVHSLNSLAILYYETGQGTLAEPLCQQALSIMEHPDIAETLHDFARFRWMNQQSTEALSLYQQALRMREQTLGADHHKTKETRADYARLLHELGQIDEVEQFAHASHAKIQTANMSDNAELTVEQSRARYPMCPTCQQNESVVRSGINRIGTQRFRCCSCQRYFTPNAKKRGYDATTKAQARTLALTGIRTREIAQQLNVHHSTISLWIKQDQQ